MLPRAALLATCLVISVVAGSDNLQEACYTLQWLENALQRCGNRCEKYNVILLRAMLLATKMLRTFIIARHITPCYFACVLCRNKFARQVA